MHTMYAEAGQDRNRHSNELLQEYNMYTVSKLTANGRWYSERGQRPTRNPFCCEHILFDEGGKCGEIQQ